MIVERPDILSAVYSLLQHCSTVLLTATIEKSFSILRKLFAMDRNFKVENVKRYLNLHFNPCTW